MKPLRGMENKREGEPANQPIFENAFAINPRAEQLARIEAKLDRLLDLLEGKKGLWVAPGPDEEQGHWTGIKLGEEGDE